LKLLYSLIFFFIFSSSIFANNILHIKINDAISPATSKYFNDSFIEAKKIDAKILLIELDTPGGLVTTTRQMVKKILNSNIPVIMYVSPKGARAASAGTFLMYASHINAMSPSTNIGAATPVSLIQESPSTQKENKKINETKTAMQNKIINDTTAYIKSLAEHNNRNVKWAIDTVKEGKSISATEALEKNVIDYLASDINELLLKIDGKKIKANKEEIIINTKDYNLIFFAPSWKTKILMSISNPNIAYIFLILAMYGILFEMMNPGSIFPGVIGAVSALIALYSLNILPFSYAGLLLIFLGIALIIAEFTVTGFGILGIAGVTSFAIGSLMLFDEKTLGFGVSLPIVFAFIIVSLGFFGYLMGFLIKIRNKKSVIGLDNLIGKKAIIVNSNDNKYKIDCNAELWNAYSDDKLEINEKVEVEEIDGLNIKVRSLK